MTTPELDAERARWASLPDAHRLHLFALASGVDTARALDCAARFGLDMAARDIGDLREVIA